MKLTGRRESSNVEDRRGMSGGAKAGIGGIGAIIVAALFAWMSGGDPLSAGLQAAQQQMSAKTETVDEQNFTEEEQQLATECKQILASTEDVWSKVFQEMGRTYEPPTLVLFTNQVNSACGSASAAVGPFYCSGDQKLYIDLSFFTQMKRQLGVEGNTFAYAYVIAHEIGHHVEYSLGILGKAHQAMSQTDKVSANQISVRLELLADYYAGVWAHYEDAMNHSMEYGDLEKGLELAKAIGDDWLQKKAQGRATPESFTHGTSEQRKRWLRRGFETGDMQTSTFSIQNYNDL
ncbi:MAG: neutral zinc metallopeptidase [Prevotella sp.]|jgi:predicted metalloprotease|nr:neutral zinc metallopeptidase [Prevotella sp.]MBQ8155054.1 neutral zinc metallopeptidase [Prevotella sp.]